MSSWRVHGKAGTKQTLCVTPFDFFPVTKRVTQFLIISFPSNERKKCFISKTCFTCKRESESYHTNTHKPKISQSSTFIFYFFPIQINYTLPFCSTLALIAIPRPTASGLQTGGHGRANRTV